MATYTHTLMLGTSAWQNTINHAKDDLGLLPTSCADELARLPVFAVIVVADNAVLYDGVDVSAIIQAWVATQNGWQVLAVQDDPHALSHEIVGDELLDDVSVFRYVLVPTDKALLGRENKESIAHIIDEQLTAYLKKSLKPKPNYQFATTETGEVIDLNEGQTQKHQCIDVHILSVSHMLHRHKLVCFDMDSTLIEQEVIIELAKQAGVSEQVADITERAMRGEMDFSESFARRVALLEGVSVSVVDEIIDKNISFSKGAFATIKALNAQGCRTVLVSGGFEPFARYVADTLGIHEYYANPLHVFDDKLTGMIDDNVIDGKAKARIVTKVAQEMGISFDEVVCVGDGANDLPMMGISDIGVAYKAKPIVRAKADTAVNITGLEGVLYALGHRFEKV